MASIVARIVQTRSDVAVDLLKRYYAIGEGDSPRYTGARFESITAIKNDPNVITPADLVAVSLLSVNVPPRAAVRLLGLALLPSAIC